MSPRRFRPHLRQNHLTRLGSAVAAVALGFVVAIGAVPPAASAATLPSDPPGTPTLAPTPPMGFNDWLNFGCRVNEQLMIGVADAFVANGLRDAGYQYVNIDDCWAAKARDAGGNLQADPTKFPHGMKWLADYVHARGLKFGIYSAASPTTCAGYPGSAGHYQQDMATFASWDVDYLKLDLCGSATNTLIRNNCQNTVASQDIKARYDEAAHAIRATGRPMILGVSAPASIAWWCGYDNASYRDAMTWTPLYGELWRTAVDAGQNWASILKTYTQNARLADAQSIGHWNDADMLVAGSTRVSLIEQQTQFTLWAAMAAPLLISTDLAKITPESLAILRNPDVVAVDQDRLGVQARIVQTGTGYDVLSKPLADGSRAVVLFNKSNAPLTISTDAATTGLPRSRGYCLTDLVTKERTDSGGVIAANVPAHGTVIYRARSAARVPMDAGPSTVVPVNASTLMPGTTAPVTVAVTNNGRIPLTAATLSLAGPSGWVVTPPQADVGTVAPGRTSERTFTVTVPEGSSGTLTATATYGWPGGPRTQRTGQATVTHVYASLADAYDNIGITDDAAPAAGNVDGSGNSYSAQALAAAGLTPGGSFSTGGLTFTWPTGVGVPNNVTHAVTTKVAGTGGTLGFLGAGIGASASGTGTITYTDGSTQAFTLAFPNWADSGPGDAVVVARYRNTQTGPANQGYYYRVFYRSVPLAAGKQVASVTLPETTAIHLFAAAIG